MRTPELIDFIEHITNRPSMYVCGDEYERVAAYLAGYDAASGAFQGLHEWLCMKFERHYNVVWWAVIETELDRANDRVDQSTRNERLLASMRNLLVEFVKHRDTIGLRNLYYDFGQWRRSFDWFDENVERYGRSDGPRAEP
jgi:hypothetical protein